MSNTSIRPEAVSDRANRGVKQRALERLLSKLGVPEGIADSINALSARVDLHNIVADAGTIIEDIAGLLQFSLTNNALRKCAAGFNILSKTVRLGMKLVQLGYVAEARTPPADEVLREMWLEQETCDSNTCVQHPEVGQLIFRKLFRKYLSGVAGIQEIHYLATNCMAIPTDIEAWNTTRETGRYAVLLTFKELKFVLMDEGSSFSIWHRRRDEEEVKIMVAQVSARILEELKHMMLVVKDTEKNYWDDPSSSMTFEELSDIELYDQKIYDFIQPAIKRCLQYGLKTGILLYGQPGLSKTSTALKIMKEFDSVRVRLPNSGYQKVKQILSQTTSKRIVLIDDADILDNSNKNDVNSELLNFLDSDSYDIVIMIMNEVTVTPAITRPGRLDLKMHCQPPDRELAESIVANLFTKYGHQLGLNIRNIPATVSMIQGMTHAEIHNVFKNAVRYDVSLHESFDLCYKMETALLDHTNSLHEE